MYLSDKNKEGLHFVSQEIEDGNLQLTPRLTLNWFRKLLESAISEMSASRDIQKKIKQIGIVKVPELRNPAGRHFLCSESASTFDKSNQCYLSTS